MSIRDAQLGAVIFLKNCKDEGKKNDTVQVGRNQIKSTSTYMPIFPMGLLFHIFTFTHFQAICFECPPHPTPHSLYSEARARSKLWHHFSNVWSFGNSESLSNPTLNPSEVLVKSRLFPKLYIYIHGEVLAPGTSKCDHIWVP